MCGSDSLALALSRTPYGHQRLDLLQRQGLCWAVCGHRGHFDALSQKKAVFLSQHDPVGEFFGQSFQGLPRPPVRLEILDTPQKRLGPGSLKRQRAVVYNHEK
jgi:hypothetical protein